VDGRVMVNNPDLVLRAAVDGLGIAYTIEAYAEPFLRSGQLVRVLEDWSPTIEGLFLYYPGRRQVPAALRALIDMIRTSSSRPARSSLQNPFAEHSRAYPTGAFGSEPELSEALARSSARVPAPEEVRGSNPLSSTR
jgi:LysR substrate binding domain